MIFLYFSFSFSVPTCSPHSISFSFFAPYCCISPSPLLGCFSSTYKHTHAHTHPRERFPSIRFSSHLVFFLLENLGFQFLSNVRQSEKDDISITAFADVLANEMKIRPKILSKLNFQFMARKSCHVLLLQTHIFNILLLIYSFQCVLCISLLLSFQFIFMLPQKNCGCYFLCISFDHSKCAVKEEPQYKN